LTFVLDLQTRPSEGPNKIVANPVDIQIAINAELCCFFEETGVVMYAVISV